MITNHQTPSGVEHTNGDLLDVVKIFYTIQGEGPFSGRRAVFIRLAGCNIQCKGCDTEYSNGIWLSVETIISEVMRLSTEDKLLVVVTGGEPLRQNISPLFGALVAAGYFPQLETNGTLQLSSHVASLIALGDAAVVVAPKTNKVHPTVEVWATAWKYVIGVDTPLGEDNLPLRVLGQLSPRDVARPPKEFKGTIYIQPQDHGNETDNIASAKLAAEVVLSSRDSRFCLGLQLHKYYDLE